MKIGDTIPEFCLLKHDGSNFEIKDLIGVKNIVLYFYPKDFTPGCTAQACSFRDSYEEFISYDCEIIGISSDSEDSHNSFIDSKKLPFILLSDKQGKVRELFNVPKSFLNILPGRVTYLIDKKGIIRYIFNSQFNISKHISKTLEILKTFDK